MIDFLEKFVNIALLKIDYNCNQDCIFCHEDWVNKACRKEDFLFDNWIDVLKENNIKSVLLSGGEPFFNYQKTLGLLRLFKTNNLNTIVITNGTMLSLSRIKEIGKLVDLIYLSIHTLNPRNDRRLTGKNFLKTKLINLDLLIRHNIPVIVRRLVMRDNILYLNKDLSLFFKNYSTKQNFSIEIGILEIKGQKIKNNFKKFYLSNNELIKILNSVLFKFSNKNILLENIPNEILLEKCQNYLDPIVKNIKLRIELDNQGKYMLEKL